MNTSSTDFKVGDWVTRTQDFTQSPQFGWQNFVPGKAYRVIGVSPSGWLALEGMGRGGISSPNSFVYNPDFFKLASYSARFTEHGEKATVSQGHAGEGGLQKHSIGGSYPWAVVGYGQAGHVVYVIEHLTSDSVLGDYAEDGRHGVRQWSSASYAELFLKHYLSLGPIATSAVPLAFRPVFSGARLVHPETRRINKLRESKDTLIAAVTAYYDALEQDIG